MAFRLMDADLVRAGADQRGIHQTERTTRDAEVTPARRLNHDARCWPLCTALPPDD
jgi:hypothetical protein